MNKYVGTIIVRGVAFEIHGDRYTYPELDEQGRRINKGFDYYDIYTMGLELGCLDCVNTSPVFFEIPTEKELEDYLDSINYFTTLAP